MPLTLRKGKPFYIMHIHSDRFFQNNLVVNWKTLQCLNIPKLGHNTCLLDIYDLKIPPLKPLWNLQAYVLQSAYKPVHIIRICWHLSRCTQEGQIRVLTTAPWPMIPQVFLTSYKKTPVHYQHSVGTYCLYFYLSWDGGKTPLNC
jgi:hypothetical protein